MLIPHLSASSRTTGPDAAHLASESLPTTTSSPTEGATANVAPEAWPALPVASWSATRDTVHLWTQMVGKTRLALAPMQNHWWNVPLYVNSVGLTTSLMPLGVRAGLEIVFDFVGHQLVLGLTDGRKRQLQLAPRTLADFYAEYLRKLAELDVDVTLNRMPAEIAGAIPFPEDTTHCSYDAAAMNAFWRFACTATSEVWAVPVNGHGEAIVLGDRAGASGFVALVRGIRAQAGREPEGVYCADDAPPAVLVGLRAR